jgi:hypothetical protein
MMLGIHCPSAKDQIGANGVAGQEAKGGFSTGLGGFFTRRLQGSGDRIVPIHLCPVWIMEQDRRRALRFPFDANAEFVAENSDARVSGHVSEISLNGCYLQTPDPLPVGAAMVIKIFAEGRFFEGHASVAYAKPKQGMGLAFRDVKPYFLTVLRRWLLEAMAAKQKPHG